MTSFGWWHTLSAMSCLGKTVYGRNDLLTRHWMIHHPEHQNVYARILEYTRLSAITTSWFTTLRGKPPTEIERRNALLLGAMTPLYDDLMDEEGWTHEQILTDRNQTNPALQTVQSILDEITKNVSDKALFERVLRQSGTAQDHSLLQMQSAPLSIEKLVEITSEKGAAFTLIYRVILDHPLSPKEEEAITTLGFLLQLTNDLFDVHKDLFNDQQTLLTNAKHLDPIRQLWTHQLILFRRQWQALPYTERARKKSIYQISILLGRGQVAFDRLLRLAAATGDQFRPRDYTRSQLICDMEKPSNLWASLVWANAWCSEITAPHEF